MSLPTFPSIHDEVATDAPEIPVSVRSQGQVAPYGLAVRTVELQNEYDGEEIGIDEQLKGAIAERKWSRASLCG